MLTTVFHVTLSTNYILHNLSCLLTQYRVLHSRVEILFFLATHTTYLEKKQTETDREKEREREREMGRQTVTEIDRQKEGQRQGGRETEIDEQR